MNKKAFFSALLGAIFLSAPAGATTINVTGANAGDGTVPEGRGTPSVGSLAIDASSTSTANVFSITGLDLDDGAATDDSITVTINVSAADAAGPVIPVFVNSNDRYDPNINGAGDTITFSFGSVAINTNDTNPATLDSFRWDRIQLTAFNDDKDDWSVTHAGGTIPEDGNNDIALVDDSDVTVNWILGAFRVREYDFTVELSMIPEPATFSTLGVAMLGLLAGRRRR